MFLVGKIEGGGGIQEGNGGPWSGRKVGKDWKDFFLGFSLLLYYST